MVSEDIDRFFGALRGPVMISQPMQNVRRLDEATPSH
jgi:hypothetical protein